MIKIEKFFENICIYGLPKLFLPRKTNKTQCSVATKGNELQFQKQLDFITRVDEAQDIFRKQGLNYNIRTICNLVAEQPAPRFYVCTELALRRYVDCLRGRSCIHNDTSRRMYAEIFARYEHLVNLAIASGQVVQRTYLMNKVLEQEAPCFYYEGDAAAKTYYRFKSKLRMMRR